MVPQARGGKQVGYNAPYLVCFVWLLFLCQKPHEQLEQDVSGDTLLPYYVMMIL